MAFLSSIKPFAVRPVSQSTQDPTTAFLNELTRRISDGGLWARTWDPTIPDFNPPKTWRVDSNPSVTLAGSDLATAFSNKEDPFVYRSPGGNYLLTSEGDETADWSWYDSTGKWLAGGSIDEASVPTWTTRDQSLGGDR